MLKKSLKIMADYNSSGLWSPLFDVNTEEVLNALSTELKLYLNCWISLYSCQIDWDNPNNQNWDSQNNISYWKALLSIENLVFSKARKELSDNYQIEFKSSQVPSKLRSDLNILINDWS